MNKNHTFFLFMILITFMFQGCLVTFYGTAPKSIENRVEEIKIFWNTLCEESLVSEKLEGKINDLVAVSDEYKIYLILFQTNNSIQVGRRKYFVRFFKSAEERDEFIKMTEKKKETLDSLLKSPNFDKSWNKLYPGLNVEQTIKLFPDLLDFYLMKQVGSELNMICKIENLEFVFNKRGFLISWEK